jgi:hypothetical protein
VIAILFASLLREGQVIREFLANDVAGGRLTAADLRRLATLRGRWASSCGALFQGGFRAWRRRREAQQAAADLAFLRRAAALEPDCADVAREMMFFEKLRGISER